MSAGFETVEVPMTVLPDGRNFISEQDAAEFPWVRDFIGRFSNYWQRDFHRDGWISPIRETEGRSNG